MPSTARRSLQTGSPLGSEPSSGSRVRRPVMVMRFIRSLLWGIGWLNEGRLRRPVPERNRARRARGRELRDLEAPRAPAAQESVPSATARDPLRRSGPWTASLWLADWIRMLIGVAGSGSAAWAPG